MNRLTVNYGARYEHFAHGIPEETSPAGRFTAARTFGPIDMPTWNSISPRGGAGLRRLRQPEDGGQVQHGQVQQAGSTGFSESYNPLQLTTAAVAWTDANLDGVPQGELGCVYQTAGCEINLAQLPKGFGVASLANFDPDIKRMYNVETAVSVQHELTPGRLGAGRVVSPRLPQPAAARQHAADLCGLHAVHAVQPDRRHADHRTTTSASQRVRTSTTWTRTPATSRKMWFNGFEYNFNARLPHGITLFGGGMSEKVIAQVCDEQSNPNLLLYCDQTKSGIPFRTQFKIAGIGADQVGDPGRRLVPEPAWLPARHRRAVGPRRRTAPVRRDSRRPLQLNTPNGVGTVWLITPTTTYSASSPCVAQGKCTAGQLVDPGMNVASLSVPLIAPNTEFGDRINQLDMNFSKTFKVRRISIQPKIDFFNLLNVSPVYAVRTLNYGTASYLQPQSILVGRVFQLGAIVRF